MTQRYNYDLVVPTQMEPVALWTVPTVNSPLLTANLHRLRHYLDSYLYDTMLTDFIGDPEDCELRLDTDVMLVRLHEAFVTHCGPKQAEWYFEFVKEAQYLYEIQGMSFDILTNDLALPQVQQQLQRFV